MLCSPTFSDLGFWDEVDRLDAAYFHREGWKGKPTDVYAHAREGKGDYYLRELYEREARLPHEGHG